MCLDTGKAVDVVIPFESSFRYKILRIREGRIELPNRHAEQFPALNLGEFPSLHRHEWIGAVPNTVSMQSGEKYSAGFHVFLTKEDAEDVLNDKNCTYLDRRDGDTVFRVEVRQIFFYGTQDGRSVEVCKKMKILEQLD